MMDNEDMYGFLSYGDKDTFVSLALLLLKTHSGGNGIPLIVLAILFLRSWITLSTVSKDLCFCRRISNSRRRIISQFLWSLQYVLPPAMPQTKY
jgi:hypothetical protein